MGCILACLRFNKKKNKAQLKSSPTPSKTKEPLLSKEQFVSVYVTEGSSNGQVLNFNSDDGNDEDKLDKELRDEVEFLKSCGTIVETPVELRKLSTKLTAQLPNNKIITSNPSNLTDTPFKKLVWDARLEDSDFSQNSPAIFKFGEHDSHGPLPSEDDTQIKPHCSVENSPKFESGGIAKSVCLNASPYTSNAHTENYMHSPIQPEVESNNLEVSPTKDETHAQRFTFKQSPFSTPLEIPEEMETPLPAYPFTRENTRRKNTRIMQQFVCPVKEKSDEADKRSPKGEDFEKESYDSFKRLKSFKEWVKILPENNEKIPSENNEITYSCLNKTPFVERPIFGFASMNWNEGDASTKEIPKLWEGNGIPNTTTKYKEDQKVTWHATPFEERLDKALSDEKFLPQRKEIAKSLTKFNAEGEECFV